MDNMDRASEWLQANRFGSFAMGSVDRVPRRKYHSLLILREPPTGGESLNSVLDVGEYIEVADKLYMLHGFDFGDRVEPKGFSHLQKFSFRPYPEWNYSVGELKVKRTLCLDRERDLVRMYYSFENVSQRTRVRLRPFVACRPFHKLTKENPFLNGNVGGDVSLGSVSFQFYEGVPSLSMRVSGASCRFLTRGEWVEKIQYPIEKDRGYPYVEDIYVPGEFELLLDKDAEFVFELGVGALPEAGLKLPKTPVPDSLISKLEWASEQYLLTTRKGFHSVIAGYPWFGHWGRDTFVSLPGLCLELGEQSRAEKILESYGEKLVEGLTQHGIVCAFPDSDLIMTGLDTPLLYIYAVQKLRERTPQGGYLKFMPIVCNILNALRHGADRRVHVSIDGGLYLEPGPWAVTWMDVLLDGQPVTPRAGFAVDINALFYNALCFAMDWAKVHDPSFVKEWANVLESAEEGFNKRFWSEKCGFLADSHDGSTPDLSLRPNQLWALALPYSPLTREQGVKLLEAVRRDLVTPVGLRTLSPKDPKYVPIYAGGPAERDRAYHQGTVWPWLIGIYADAYARVHGLQAMKIEIKPILEKLAQHLDREGCLGHISEVFDGDLPHRAGGAPAQAWSVAELLRVTRRMQQ